MGKMAGYRHNGEFRITEHSSRKAAVVIAGLLTGLWLSFALGGPSAAAEEGRNADGRISLHVSQAPAGGVLQALASMTGKNIVLSGQISQTITADLENVTPMEAIRHVADTGGLQIRDAGDTLFVAGDSGEKSAGSVRCFYLSYADAEEVAENLKTVLKTGSASANVGANLVVVRASPGELMGAEMLISALDKPERQAKVEAQVLAVNKSHTKELGIDWDFKSLTGSAPYEEGEGKHSGRRYVKMPEGYAGISYGKSVAGAPYTFFFQARLNALVSKGQAEVLARPNVVTLNGRKAKILIGSEIPVLVDHIENGVTTTTIEYKEAGISLSYTPVISEHDEITARIEAEVSTPYLEPEMKAYRIVTRKAQTMVRIKSGEIITIGGLIDHEKNESVRKIPVLGDIPILGRLFQSHNKNRADSEIVIAIKADILE